MADKKSMQPSAEKTQPVVADKDSTQAVVADKENVAVVKVKRWSRIKKKATVAKERPMVSYCCVLCGTCFDDSKVSEFMVLECSRCGGCCAELLVD